jgi:hypothetical protein
VEFRIGERDPVTGLYYVIWPDGTKMLNGIKTFNAEHQIGEVVEATRRSDGMWILDSSKAIDRPVQQLELEKFGEQPIGYLNGQVFNVEEEVGSLVSITLLPDPPPNQILSSNQILLRFSRTRPFADVPITYKFLYGRPDDPGVFLTSQNEIYLGIAASGDRVAIVQLADFPFWRLLSIEVVAGIGYKVDPRRNKILVPDDD